MRSAVLAAERAAAAALSDLRRGVASLATVAATAPLIGLWGTLVGIRGSFRGCSGGMWFCLAALVESLGESLYPCALGLLVGIVAFTAYQHFRGLGERLEHELRIAGDVVGEAKEAKGAAERLRAHLPGIRN